MMDAHRESLLSAGQPIDRSIDQSHDGRRSVSACCLGFVTTRNLRAHILYRRGGEAVDEQANSKQPRPRVCHFGSDKEIRFPTQPSACQRLPAKPSCSRSSRSRTTAAQCLVPVSLHPSVSCRIETHAAQSKVLACLLAYLRLEKGTRQQASPVTCIVSLPHPHQP